MASRNSFLDSPSFRRITPKSQRDKVERNRSRSRTTGRGTRNDPIRRATPQEQRENQLEQLQKDLSASGTRISSEEAQAIIEGRKSVDQIRQEINTRQRRESLSNLQSQLSRTGTRLTEEEAQSIISGTGDLRSISERALSRGRRQTIEKNLSGININDPRIGTLIDQGLTPKQIQDLQAREVFLQRNLVDTNNDSFISREEALASGGIVERQVPRNDLFFGERLENNLERRIGALRSQRPQGNTFRDELANLSFDVRELLLGAGVGVSRLLSSAEFITRGAIAPSALAAQNIFGLDVNPRTQRVVDVGVNTLPLLEPLANPIFDLSFGRVLGLRPRTTVSDLGSFAGLSDDLLFAVTSPVADFNQKLITDTLTPRDVGLASSEIAQVFTPQISLFGGRTASSLLAGLRSDFVRPQRIRGRGFRVDESGVTIRPGFEETIIPNVGDDFINLRVRGGVASTAETLEQQLARAGTTVNAVSAQSSLLPLFDNQGVFQLREPINLDKVFFADPSTNVRTSRLQLGDVGFGTDLLSGNTQFTLFGGRPQIISLPDVKISDFPDDIARIIARDPTGRSFTQSEIDRIINFQLEPRTDFTAPGFISIESEIVTTAPELFFTRVGTTRVGNRRVPIFQARTTDDVLDEFIDGVDDSLFSRANNNLLDEDLINPRVLNPSPTTRQVSVLPVIASPISINPSNERNISLVPIRNNNAGSINNVLSNQPLSFTDAAKQFNNSLSLINNDFNESLLVTNDSPVNNPISASPNDFVNENSLVPINQQSVFSPVSNSPLPNTVLSNVPTQGNSNLLDPIIPNTPPNRGRRVFINQNNNDNSGEALFEVTIGSRGQQNYAELGIGGVDLVRRAETIVDNTPAASIRAKPLNNKARNTNVKALLGREYRKSKDKMKKNRYVEKNAFRINSPGELLGITNKGIIANKNQRVTNNSRVNREAQRLVSTGVPLRTVRNNIGGGRLDDFF